MTVTLVNGDYPVEWFNAAIAARIVGMDIETNGLDRTIHKIATVQMYVPDMGTIMVRNLQDVPLVLLRLMQSKQVTKIFHHAPFDLGFLVEKYDIYPEKIACTKVAAKILDPKRQMFFDPDTNKGSHALKSLVYHYFGFRMDKTLAISDWFAEDLSEAQLDYAAKDVEFLPALLRNLEKELAGARKIRLAREAMKHLPTNTVLQVKGFQDDIYSY